MPIYSKNGFAAIFLALMLLAVFTTSVCSQPVAKDSTNSKTLTEPPMVGPLVFNSQPIEFQSQHTGKIYFAGAVSGLTFSQTQAKPREQLSELDFSNAQIIVQKPEGKLQFYLQGGIYSIPVIGTSYLRAVQNINELYGPLPVANVAFAFSDNFSIRAGKLPTLIGPEPTFSFQNMNIQRGLLWNQEPAVSRGVQIDHESGALKLSASINDGFYSGQYSWLVSAATFAFDGNNSMSLVAGSSVKSIKTNTFTTPAALNNAQIYNLVYMHTESRWKATSYFQMIQVPARPDLGIQSSAESYGAAVLINYSLSKNVNIAGRLEHLSSTGSISSGAPDLLYGPGSRAWTLTLTPTYQDRRFFLRAEPSLVVVKNIAPGRGFGSNAMAKEQIRFLVEAGILF